MSWGVGHPSTRLLQKSPSSSFWFWAHSSLWVKTTSSHNLDFAVEVEFSHSVTDNWGHWAISDLALRKGQYSVMLQESRNSTTYMKDCVLTIMLIISLFDHFFLKINQGSEWCHYQFLCWFIQQMSGTILGDGTQQCARHSSSLLSSGGSRK